MIYTRTGDNGTTSLVGGERVSKDDVRIEAVGTLDELNAHLGLLVEMAAEIDKDICVELKDMQCSLFVLQGIMASSDESYVAERMPLFGEKVVAIEKSIDKMTANLPDLKTFVRPGGSMAAAQCHVARTVCRRAERRITSLHFNAELFQPMLSFVNRLSDYLFVLSRHLLHCEGIADDRITTC